MFNVESGISAQLLSPYSPKVKLVEFSAKDDIGIFKLLDEYEPRTDYIDLGWITESDDIYSMNLSAGRKVACTGYSGKIRDEDVMLVKQEAALQLTKSLPHLAFTVSILPSFRNNLVLKTPLDSAPRSRYSGKTRIQKLLPWHARPSPC
jgi:hypothetical protein